MKDIDVIVTRRDTVCSDFVWLMTKSKNAYRLIFNFLVPWDKDLKLQAVFKAPYQQPVAIDLDEEFSCIVPYEVTVRTGILFVGIRGIKNIPEEEIPKNSIMSYNIIKSTNNLEIPIVKGVF